MKKILKLILWPAVFIIIVGSIFIFWLNYKETNATKKRIRSLIANFNSHNPRSFYSVSEIAEIGEKTLPYLQEMIKSNSLEERWAAVISLSTLLRKNPQLENTILPLLKQILKDKNATLKMLAAAQLLSFGEKNGIPVLISSLKSKEITIFSDPPLPVAMRANQFLRHYTGQEFGYQYDSSAEDKEQIVNRWQKWWNNNKKLLLFNKEEGIFQTTK